MFRKGEIRGPDQYHPITCLNTTYKLLMGTMAELLSGPLQEQEWTISKNSLCSGIFTKTCLCSFKLLAVNSYDINII